MIAVYESGRYRVGHGKTRQSGHGCKKARRQPSPRFFRIRSLPQVFFYQHLQKLIPVQLADQGAGPHVVGDIGGVL